MNNQQVSEWSVLVNEWSVSGQWVIRECLVGGQWVVIGGQ